MHSLKIVIYVLFLRILSSMLIFWRKHKPYLHLSIGDRKFEKLKKKNES